MCVSLRFPICLRLGISLVPVDFKDDESQIAEGRTIRREIEKSGRPSWDLTGGRGWGTVAVSVPGPG